MELKKSDKANLESKKRIFTEIGFVIVLLLLLGIFEYSSKQSEIVELVQGEAVKADEEMVEVTREPEPPKPEIEEPQQEEVEAPEIVETDDKEEDQSAQMKAQDDNQEKKVEAPIFEEEEEENEEIFMRVEKQPSFPGGNAALQRFIGNNVNYPQEAIDMGLQGKVVVKFVVNEKGKAVRPEVLKKVSPELDQAAIDVVNKLPLFTPGEQAGKKVKVWYIVPIDFKLAQ